MEALQRLHNRGSISTGYDVDNSLKFEEDNLEAVYAQPTADGNQRTWTVSMWFKRTEITTSGAYHTLITALVGAETGSVYITPTDELICDVGLGGTRNRQQTAMKFRDTSAWYHIVWRVDTTQGTAADRHRLYVNGVLQEWTTIDGYPAQNFQSNWNNNYPIYIGCYSTYNNYGMSGYIAEVHHTDGISHAPTEFGEVDEASGIWKPKAYTGSYGAQGFYLPFDDSSNLGTNAKGNDVNFTLQNITAADQATDTPTNNFATFNVAQPRQSGTTIAEGGTEMYVNSNYQTAVSSIAVSKGKWYAEFIAGGHTCYVGFVDVSEWTIPQLHNGYFLGYSNSANTMSVAMKGTDGNFYNDNNSASGATFGTGDIISVALDMDNRKAYWAVNGTYVNSGNPATGANPVTWYTYRDNGPNWTDVITMGITGYSNTYHRCNFGGYSSVVPSSAASDADGYGTFEYAPPSGYYALCTKNLEEYG